MKNIFIMAALLICFTLIGCANETENVGTGALNIAFNAESPSEKEAGVRAAVTDLTKFQIVLMYEGLYGPEDKVIGPMQIPADGKISSIPSGPYDIFVQSHNDIPAASFDNPYYMGFHATIIEPGKTQSLNISCFQGNSGIRFEFHESLQEVGMENLTAVIRSEQGTLRYEGQNRLSTGYFPSGEVEVTVYNGTEPVKINGIESRILTLSTNQLWKITLSAVPQTAARSAGEERSIGMSVEKF